MIFSSVIFNWIFLPVTLGLYYLVAAQPWGKEETAGRAKNAVLLLASLVFYGLGGYRYLLILLAVLVINFISGLLIDRQSGKVSKLVLILAVIADLGILFFFKYFNIVVLIYENLISGLPPFKIWNNIITLTRTGELAFTDIVLPIGISFYIFQSISYIADVKRGEAKVQKNFIDYALYVSFFPQLIAGPIVRFSDIEKQIRFRHETIEQLSEGITRFILGLSKKVLIANEVGKIADEIWNHKIGGLGAGVTWLAAISYTLQIFYDFSGYSDMAIGLGKMFGFNIKENFNYPYISGSITEFWRRWHISLGTWFKEYVYIPLGGSRNGLGKTLINLLIVFTLTGIWHGANFTFLLWGLIYALLLIVEKLFLKKVLDKNPVRFLNHIYVMISVIIAWIFFRADNIQRAGRFIAEMFRAGDGEYSVLSFLSMHGIAAIAAGIVFCFPIYPYLKKKVESNTKALKVLTPVHTVILILLFVYSMIVIVSGSYNPFIYYRF